LALCIAAWIYDQKKKQRRAATAGLLKDEQVALNIERPGSYGATSRLA
jgi:cbb3-type cytochrome oxidase subunit 3